MVNEIAQGFDRGFTLFKTFGDALDLNRVACRDWSSVRSGSGDCEGESHVRFLMALGSLVPGWQLRQ